MDPTNNNSSTAHQDEAAIDQLLDLSLTISPASSCPLPPTPLSLPPPPFPQFPHLLPPAAGPPYWSLLAAQLHHPPPSPPPPHGLPILPPQRDGWQLPRPNPRDGRQLPRPNRPASGPIPPPYPWATDRRAKVHSLPYLRANGTTTISGQLRCKRCDRQFEIQHDLIKKFGQLRRYIVKNVLGMHDRAPNRWDKPVFPGCSHCGQANSLRPVPTKKKDINWLFLLLGELIGYCTIKDLKYFCKHTSNHRTGAKNRLIYITYMILCRQLDPTGPYYISTDL